MFKKLTVCLFIIFCSGSYVYSTFAADADDTPVKKSAPKTHHKSTHKKTAKSTTQKPPPQRGASYNPDGGGI